MSIFGTVVVSGWSFSDMFQKMLNLGSYVPILVHSSQPAQRPGATEHNQWDSFHSTKVRGRNHVALERQSLGLLWISKAFFLSTVTLQAVWVSPALAKK